MYIKVAVTPGSKKESIEETGKRSFAVSVREPAAHNHANRRVRELLALRFGIPLAKVRILTGHRSRTKMFSIDN